MKERWIFSWQKKCWVEPNEVDSNEKDSPRNVLLGCFLIFGFYLALAGIAQWWFA